MAEPTPSTSPVPIPELTKFAEEACSSALNDVTGYEHSNVGEWNSSIINTILKSLITATTPSSTDSPSPAQPPYRFVVNSTIVQQGHLDKSEGGSVGKRGMHSASGAFWDVNRDGMWTFKYAGAEEKGLDVIVSVTWFALG